MKILISLILMGGVALGGFADDAAITTQSGNIQILQGSSSTISLENEDLSLYLNKNSVHVTENYILKNGVQRKLSLWVSRKLFQICIGKPIPSPITKP